MDLNYGAEYEEFRQDVQAFCKEYQGVSFKSESADNQMNDALSGSSTTEKTLFFQLLKSHSKHRSSGYRHFHF